MTHFMPRGLFTNGYKGGFIHGYCDRDECRWQHGDQGGTARTYRAAQIRITRAAKEEESA